MKNIRMYVIKAKPFNFIKISVLLFLLGLSATPFILGRVNHPPYMALPSPENPLRLPQPIDIAKTILPIPDVQPQTTPKKSATPSPVPENITITTAPANKYNPARGIYIQNDTPYSFDIDELLETPVRFDKNASVLIYHTHTSEAYTPSEKYSYTSDDPYRSTDAAFNTVLIGNRISDILTERGVSVIHDPTGHDYPSYSGSYDRSLATIEKNLAENPSIALVLDIHRDAITDEHGNYLKTYMPASDPPCAQALIVVGTDNGGLYHPDWQENLKVGIGLQQIMNEKYPSLARPLHLRTERFNGHASKGALLLEIGSNGNTTEEALACAELVADCIACLFE